MAIFASQGSCKGLLGIVKAICKSQIVFIITPGYEIKLPVKMEHLVEKTGSGRIGTDDSKIEYCIIKSYQ